MPQYEFKPDRSGNSVSVIRARSARDAVRAELGLPSDAVVEVVGADDLTELRGWQHVVVDGKDSGSIRLFQRMKFRRQ